MCGWVTEQDLSSWCWSSESRRAMTRRSRRIQANWSERGLDCMEFQEETGQKKGSEG